MRQSSRKIRRIVVSTALIPLSLVAGIVAWVVFPPRDSPVPSDAVMVIAGYWDGRHQAGARLVEEGIFENFVVSNPGGAKDKIGSAHCRGKDRPAEAVEVWCLRPTPVTTTGEALTMGELAVSEEWSSVTVITGRFHSRRVHKMFTECTNLDVSVIFVDQIRRHSMIAEVMHEIGGFIDLWVTNPCRDLP